MELKYDVIRVPKTPEAARQVVEELFPLLFAYWDKHGKPATGEEFDFDTQAFMMNWHRGGVLLVLARREGKAVGYLLGSRFRPMFYVANALQIEQIYGDTPEVERGLADYLRQILRVQEASEVIIPNLPTQEKIVIGEVPAQDQHFTRYIL